MGTESREIENPREKRASAARKPFESAQSESQQRYESLVHTIDGIVWEVDAQTFEFTFISKQAERILGYPLEQWLNEPSFWANHLHPDDREWAVNFCVDATARGVDHQFEYRMIAADGRVIWLRDIVTVYVAEDNSVWLRGVMMDITERKLVEQALDERLRFETLLTELSAAFAKLSPAEVDQEIDKWLQRLVEFLGVERATFLHFKEDGKTLYRSNSYVSPGLEPISSVVMNDLFPWVTQQLRQGKSVIWERLPDDLPEQAAGEREYAARLGIKSGISLPIICGSTLCVVAFFSTSVYREWPDELVARLRVVGEIFANAFVRKNTDEAIRESESRFRAIFEKAGIGIALGDLCGYDLESNPALCEMLGYSAEELRRIRFTDFTHPDNVERDWGLFQELIEGKRESYEVEKRYLRRDGEAIWARLVVSLIRTADGEPLHTIGTAENITERKLAEDALRESEERFRQLAENIREVFWMTTLDLSDMLYVSPAYESVWGQTCESLYQDPRAFLAAIHPEDHPRVAHILEKERERGFEVEYRVVRPDGTIRWIRDRGFPIKDESGVAFRIAGIAEDITERKHTEESLKLFRALIDRSSDAIEVIDPKTLRFLDCNESAYKSLGYSREEFLTLRIMDIDPTIDESRHKQIAAEMERSGFATFESLHLRKDGSRFPVEVTVTVIQLERGFYRLAVVRDITKRKRAEESLRQEKDFSDTTIDSLPGIFYFIDDQRNYIRWNKNLEHVTGYTHQEIASMQPMDFFAGADKKLIAEKIEETFKLGDVSTEASLITRDGRALPYFLTGRRILFEQKPAVLGMGIDITKRKRAEEQLKSISEQLRALTVSLRHAREEEGTRIAREIHDELGSALTSLRWDLESFDKSIAESPQLQSLREKISDMMRLTDTTINSVRRISSELRPSLLDDLGLVEAIEWQAQQFQARTGIICNCVCSPENISLNRDQKTAVFRIFQEALTNVLRHAQATRVDIEVREEAGEFILTITDNGQGITEAQKSAPQSIGLLGMRERAHLVGGRININGVQGKGTVVTVLVPASEAG